MDAQQDSKRNGNAPLIIAAVAVLLVVAYAASSGPMKIGFEKMGMAYETHGRVYAPVVWIKDNTAANRVVDWYWNKFQTQWDLEDDAALDKWLYSPKFGMNVRDLGVD
jgi:hypothetical protein